MAKDASAPTLAIARLRLENGVRFHDAAEKGRFGAAPPEVEGTSHRAAPRSTSVRTVLAVLIVISAGAFAFWSGSSLVELDHRQGRLLEEVRNIRESRLSTLQGQPVGDVPGYGREFRRKRNIAGRPASPRLNSGEQQLRELRVRLEELEAEMEARLRVLQVGAVAAGARESIFARFDEGEGAARARAVEDLAELARFGDPEAREALMLALEDQDPRIRRQATEALGRLSRPPAGADLEPLIDDPSAAVRRELATTLGMMPREEAVPLLMKLLDDGSSGVVEEAITSLVELGYKPAHFPLEDLLTSGDLDVVAAAGRGLRKLGDPAGAAVALDRVAEDLHDPDPLVRLETLRRIRRIKTPAAPAYVAELLQDENAQVRESAEKILLQLGPP